MSMNIDISNYELYVMDYMDGALSAIDKAHFEAFLLKHPDVAMEVEELMDSELRLVSATEGVTKDNLKITVKPSGGIDESNYEEIMAFSIDTDLASNKRLELNEFVALNPALKRDFELYQATKLTPAEDLVFAGKRDLKRPIPLFNISAGAYRSVAAILVLFGIIGLLNSIQDEIYIPREGLNEFAELSMDFSGSVYSESVEDETVIAMYDSPNQSPSAREVMPTMEKPKATLKWEPQPIFERELPSLAFVRPMKNPDVILASNDRSEELNITQFVGKEFLGLEPEKTQTTKSLIKESARKVIDQSEQFALNTESDDKNKKTFSLLAGAVEFKRVTYN